MKYTLTFLVLSFLTTFSLFAAGDTITLTPGSGKIQTAINQYGADVVYRLQAGEVYQLEGIISVSPQALGSDKTLTIVGEETAGMPAIIQVGRTSQGAPERAMFDCTSNLTLKNLFLTGKDREGEFSQDIINLNAQVNVTVDNCVIDPAGTRRTINGTVAANGSSLYLTNSQIYRNGRMDTPNDGGWTGGMAWDTLWVENNTLVSSGQDFIGGTFHREPNNQFIWINHNTIMWHDVWIKKSYNDQNFYFTNNLLHDESLFPELPIWYQYFPDFEHGNNLLCQLAIDTLEIGGVKETLPSQRRMFWEYNLMYYSPELQKVPKYAEDNGIMLTYLLPMLWDEDVPLSYSGGVEIASPADSCREYGILHDQVNWPHMKYDNNWYDIDPLYKDTMIYCISDSAGEHILGFYRGQFWNEPGAPAVEDLPSYNWDIDAYRGHAADELPQTWPRFDGSYSNPTLLTASLEGLPLGDLNWYPEQKFQWYANRKLIENHVLGLNEGIFELQDPATISYRVELIIRNEEDNPVQGALLLIGEDTLGISDAAGLIALDTLAGSYPYDISAEGFQNKSGQFTVDYSSFQGIVVLQEALNSHVPTLSGLKIRVYPNPVGSGEVIHVRIDNQDLSGVVRLGVFDMRGQLLKQSDFKGQNILEISTASLARGVYLVSVSTETTISNSRLIVK